MGPTDGQVAFRSPFRLKLKAMIRAFFLAVLAVATTATAVSAQSYSGRPERRDPIFLRFPEMAQRYWVNTETMAASHKAIAIPMPRQRGS